MQYESTPQGHEYFSGAAPPKKRQAHKRRRAAPTRQEQAKQAIELLRVLSKYNN